MFDQNKSLFQTLVLLNFFTFDTSGLGVPLRVLHLLSSKTPGQMWKNTLSLRMKGVHCKIAVSPFSIFESKSMDFHKEIHMKPCLLFTLIETYQYDMI